MKLANWVAKLRSGEYVQGIGALHKIRGIDETYCCLGVLAEIRDLPSNFDIQRQRWIFFPEGQPLDTHNSSDCYLPSSIRFDDVEWVCNKSGHFEILDIIEDKRPYVQDIIRAIYEKYYINLYGPYGVDWSQQSAHNSVSYGKFTLSVLNDMGASFEQIADILSCMR